MKSKARSGFAVALAWPETYCKQPGYWYDPMINWLGISKNHYYKVGHAAIILVDKNDGKCYYYDFGRYQAPFKHGRARGENTDPGLAIRTRADIAFDGKTIENLDAILDEIQHNAEYHGEGVIQASYVLVSFNKAMAKAKYFQDRGAVEYGPFRVGGTNCSRFVRSVIRAGKPGLGKVFKLNFLVPFSPTPMNNVNSLSYKTHVEKKLTNPAFNPFEINAKKLLKSTLPIPKKVKEVAEAAQWISGEGAGAWFHILKNADDFLIKRLSETGEVEFSRNFRQTSGISFNPDQEFDMEYVSHAEQVWVVQSGERIGFTSLNNDKT